MSFATAVVLGGISLMVLVFIRGARHGNSDDDHGFEFSARYTLDACGRQQGEIAKLRYFL